MFKKWKEWSKNAKRMWVVMMDLNIKVLWVRDEETHL